MLGSIDITVLRAVETAIAHLIIVFTLNVGPLISITSTLGVDIEAGRCVHT